MGVSVAEQRLMIPTYPEGSVEPLPMFAENRVHQRTSGRPYPNCVVLTTDREHRFDKQYTVLHLENEYLSIGILPELGGRIFWATDKTTGYDFFYRQHVIKPALIGVLGSWISGGVEFNWPFHHRPSTFMSVDYAIEKEPDGSVTVWLSEHDPMERMKGMVGIRLRPGQAVLETRVRLANRTPVARSFLWWENAAVPVNEDYQIFFPPDVSHVNFHYHRSVATWPLAAGVYNGIRLGDRADLRWHKNTRSPTSYFSAASRYDFFGGYDHGQHCGVVHVANHHVSPGKKLFTWAYNQLSRSWEKALTDDDGPYAELMAGSYSDNQPDFAWLEPYETRQFSQHWYPIGGIGVPVCANLQAAISVQRSPQQITLAVQAVRVYERAGIRISAGSTVLCEATADLAPAQPWRITCPAAPGVVSILITEGLGGTILAYTEDAGQAATIPAPWGDLPAPDQFTTAQELHLAGVHVEQYRSPGVLPDAYWQASLLRDPDYGPALVDLGCFHYKRGCFTVAEGLLRRARQVVTRHNANPRNGESSYLLGLTLLARGNMEDAYDAFYKATWSQAQRSCGLTMLAAIDGRRGDFQQMLAHAEAALETDAANPLAGPLAAAAELRSGDDDAALARLDRILEKDRLNHLARYLRFRAVHQPLTDFYEPLQSSPAQTCLDLAYDLLNAGLRREAEQLLENLPGETAPMVGYTLGTLCLDRGATDEAGAWFARAEQAPAGRTYPFRLEELAVLRQTVRHNPALSQAWCYLGCLLYDKGHHAEAAECWHKSIAAGNNSHLPHRNLAVAFYSHLGREDEVLPRLRDALVQAPGDAQLVYEISHVMAKLGATPEERVAFLSDQCQAGAVRDEIALEWVRALNQTDRSDRALEILAAHTFVPCEGGEHAVAEQFMFAHHNLGRGHLIQGRHTEALAHFQKSQVLPDELGAGLWHEALLVPHQYYEAICLERLGDVERALAIHRHIVGLSIDDFSEMHLPELPVYQALSMKRMQQGARADHVLRTALTRWTEALSRPDTGCFKTTPFFISYIDAPQRARTAHFRYLTGMAKAALDDQVGARGDFRQSVESDPSRLYPWLESRLCAP